jgi:tetratricopeptide (TPR) repeat protein
VQAVKDQPTRNPDLTAIVTRMLVATGKQDDVSAILKPLVPTDPIWRRMYLSLAAGGVTSASAAGEWIKNAAGAAPAGALDEQFTVARAWQEMGARLNDAGAIASARDILKNLVDHPGLGTAPLLMLASLDTDAGDLSPAEDLYRRALKIDANLPDAMNNLAYILVTHSGDLNEAKDLVTRAIGISPNVGAFHDTLARINEALDDRDAAQQEFSEALRLDPDSLDARIGLSRTLRAAGNRDKAQQELQRIDTQLNGNLPSSEQTRRELQSLRESLSSSSVAE